MHSIRLNTDVVLDYWCGIGEIKPGGAFAETLEKKTGIKINVINASSRPSAAEGAIQFAAGVG